jgi:hypothetical protein
MPHTATGCRPPLRLSPSGSMSADTAAAEAPRPASRSRDGFQPVMMAGLLAHGSNAACPPSQDQTQWHSAVCSPLTVAGAAAALGRTPHRIPFSPSSRKDHHRVGTAWGRRCQLNASPCQRPHGTGSWLSTQPTVSIIAAIGAVVLLSEALTPRLVLASACILGGVALAILSRKPAKGV